MAVSHTQHPKTVSVIIPAYNSEGSVNKTIESLQRQTIEPDRIEIILVNDGSTDNTSTICHQYAKAAKNIIVIDKENGGVGSARNAGIEAACGKYIAFLDSDDTLLPETLEAVTGFFDAHYDEIDVVSYPMKLYDENREWSHVREKVMTRTGVYDLTKLQYAFALITNVNVVVKNNCDLPRFREDLIIHEDELFFLTILLRKQKVGFCKRGAYRYQQLPGSAISTKMHPLYQFENNVGFWEDLFAEYPRKAPLYLQASFLNEINWKIKKDLVFPYHYDKENFIKAVDRLGKLMDRVDNDVIFTSPRADEYLQHYLLSLKTDPQLTCSVNKNGVVLSDEQGTLLCRRAVDVEFVRTHVDGNAFYLRGALKSIAFNHADTPELHLYVDDKAVRSIEVQPSALGRNQAHVQTNVFWGFCVQVPLESCERIAFSVRIGGIDVPTRLRFSAHAQLNTENGITSFAYEDKIISLNDDERSLNIKYSASFLDRQKSWTRNTKSVLFSNPKSFLMRLALKLRKKNKTPTWLYYDRTGIGGDNSYYQFLHDFDKNDGIDRYYVTRDSKATLDVMFEKRHRAALVKFNSVDHRFLHLQADRIIASYIETPNWSPFAAKTLCGMADVIHYDLVYLQHGVLHAHMPWKYSADRLPIDYEVVSTQYEIDNLTHSYGFQTNQLIPCGMPRYDYINPVPSQRKILLAPSWRKQLVTELPGLKFAAKPGALQSSTFWRETARLLSSETLSKLLEESDYHLDIKLHPILEVYAPEFDKFSNERIHIVKEVCESDYSIFITDYSSWVFDFVYQNRAIAYFLPDEDEFKSGINGYRRLDLPLDQGFGPLANNADNLIEIIRTIVKRNGRPEDPYRKRMDDFFLHYDNKQCERLYKALIASFANRRIS